LISRKRAEIFATAESDAKGGVGKKHIQGRDLLSLLIKANMATDIADSARMNDEEILARELRMLFLGYILLTSTIGKRFQLSSLPVMKQRGTYGSPSN
jgi:hypothetical protein